MVIEVEDHKIAYMALPKAACSSVKAAFALSDPRNSVSLADIEADDMLVHNLYRTKRFRPYRWQGYSDWWRFTVIRDPLQRLLSVYTDCILRKNYLQNSPKMQRNPSLSKNPDPDEFFQNLPVYMDVSSAIKHHTLWARRFIGPPPLQYDRVYKTSELDQLAADLSKRMGKDVVIPHLNKSKEKLRLDDLSPATQAHIRERVIPEYDDLSDYYDNPFLSPNRKRSRPAKPRLVS